MDYAFETVRRELTGGTMKSFYYSEGDPKFRIVMLIMRQVGSKEFTSSFDNIMGQ